MRERWVRCPGVWTPLNCEPGRLQADVEVVRAETGPTEATTGARTEPGERAPTVKTSVGRRRRGSVHTRIPPDGLVHRMGRGALRAWAVERDKRKRKGTGTHDIEAPEG
ncbi:hypothetical protein NDU88_008614 [Pleurodeles waltl]|uniref:Uncharacterized protein n=1 Tax=Pleurodeles waltl TaxID=8319 RepID=A0AAV7QP17_PLEWA|nr:hypothetical protein NDU88_008614 [Pleurodeles waltl]